MKQVTMESVKERIARIEDGVEAGLVLGLRHEFELACLRELVAVTEQRDALVAENVGMKSAVPEPRNVEFDNDSMDDVSLAEDFGFNDAVGRMKINMSKTPATDAAIAALQAEGVEMFAEHLRANDSDKSVCKMFALGAEDFARQLRESKGANHE